MHSSQRESEAEAEAAQQKRGMQIDYFTAGIIVVIKDNRKFYYHYYT